MSDQQAVSASWLLLIHQIPPKPDYLRVKIGRRLQRVGAVAVKSSVYALPDGDQPLEDFQWIRREIIDGGGDATICRAAFVDGLSDEQLRDSFREARDADYAEIAVDAQRADDLTRIRKRFAAVSAIDYFSARGRAEAHSAIERAEAALAGDAGATDTPATSVRSAENASYRGRTWVTRSGIFVDRMASVWLIRRYIDPDARFRYVDADRYRHTPGELRFDMFEGEFTHRGDQCTFEVLLDRFALADPALKAIAEIVHDIDLRDDKFGRTDGAGVERALMGIAQASTQDSERAERAAGLFEALYAAYQMETGSR